MSVKILFVLPNRKKWLKSTIRSNKTGFSLEIIFALVFKKEKCLLLFFKMKTDQTIF